MGYLEDIIETQEKEVASYDPKKYRERISGLADKYGLHYDTFSGAKKTTNYNPYIYGGLGLVLIAGGIFLYKKMKSKKK